MAAGFTIKVQGASRAVHLCVSVKKIKYSQLMGFIHDAFLILTNKMTRAKKPLTVSRNSRDLKFAAL